VPGAARLSSADEGAGQTSARQAQGRARQAPARSRHSRGRLEEALGRALHVLGDGAEAVLEYVARYVHRVAITNNRIVGLDDAGVTIRHKERTSGRWVHTRLSRHEFMRRFLQHVLPKGLHKIRYFGLWHPSQREQAARARLLLQLDRPADPGVVASASETPDDATARSPASGSTEEARICPSCKEGRLVEIGRLYPKQASGP
jgi:hypothetical protein